MLFSALQAAGHAVLFAQGFRARTLEAHGARFRVYDRAGKGTGPPMLLVHGLGGAATSWVALAFRLLPHASWLRLVELPGHGRREIGLASGDDLIHAVGRAHKDLVERSGERPLLVGNSLGGALVLASALAHPERTFGVVGLSPAGAPLGDRDRVALSQTFRAGREGGLEFGRRLYHRAPRMLPLFAKDLGAHFGSAQVQSLLAQANALGERLTLELLRTLAVPALVGWGASDRVLPRASVEFFRQALGSDRVELWNEVGHIAQVEDPARVAARLVRFMDDVRSGRLLPEKARASGKEGRREGGKVPPN